MAVAPVGSTTDFWKMETSTTAGGAGTNPWAAVDRTTPAITLANGDVLWAQVSWNASEAPNMASPAGWTVVTGWPFVQASLVGAVIAYRVVTDTGTEPTTYTWQPKATDGTTNQAARGNVGIRVYRGVDTGTPLDATPVRTSGVSGAGGSAISMAQITTVTAGAYVLTGLGVEASSATTTITSPAGLTKIWDLVGRRQSMAEEGVQAVAGGSGALSWSISPATLNYTGYQAALRPAAGAGDAGTTLYGYEVTISG